MKTLRLPEAFKHEATAYADSVGVSFNALVLVALREYLDARPAPGGGAVATDPAAAKTPARASVPKVAKHQRCPCGSGKTYGKCHGKVSS